MSPVRPPGATENEDLVKTRLAAVGKGGGTPETFRIEWRSEGNRNLPVIDMPVSALYYNPETHRIRAQRAHDPARDAALTADPWTPQSQAYLHDLLMAKPDNPDIQDPDFVALMEDLKNNAQNTAGLITPTGIVVDGNTRCAALREIGQPNIRVAVLPEDWGWGDVNDVELSLQLRKTFRRDYSFINEIIAHAELLAAGRSLDETAAAFRKKRKTIEQGQWALALIDEAIKRSRAALDDGTGVQLRRLDFEGHQESLREIYERYKRVRAQDPDLAQRLREASLAALLVDAAKTDIRSIWLVEDFDEKYLKPKLTTELKVAPATSEPAGVSIPGLSITMDAEDSKIKEARATTDKLLRAKARSASAAKLSPAETARNSALIAEADKAIRESLRQANRDVRQAQRKMAAPEKLDEATDALRACIDDIAKARAQNVLDNEALDDALMGLRDTLTRLGRTAARGVRGEPGPGLSWLLLATMD
ncbi:hypothetical protein AGRA3207_003496 [Actinomadura graeca]|uniref:Transcriptional regulator n=1 Tax=Actinomadura graeca TaxID=2750812 RepID=A0ABX8QUJ3_9ACTN|nr:hypothetical protein [Actinomadura graeca]QXJ22491.1 hypothetical protein AGRA3207_003496 [Actinomadura graeca]